MATKPSAVDIHDYFWKFKKYTKMPCGDLQAENQCAIRLSMALEGLSPGFLDEFTPQKRVHRNRPTCPTLPPHVLGAAELGRFLSTQWGRPLELTSSLLSGKARIRSGLRERTGILWFESCYEVSPGVRSDHIDFWNGWHYMNELLEIGAGGDAGAKADLFARSSRVNYFPVL